MADRMHPRPPIKPRHAAARLGRRHGRGVDGYDDRGKRVGCSRLAAGAGAVMLRGRDGAAGSRPAVPVASVNRSSAPMIDFYTAGTGNGRRPALMLEECGLAYTTHKIDLAAARPPEILKANPVGAIPAILDRDGGEPVDRKSTRLNSSHQCAT